LSGADCEVETAGVFTLPKATGAAWAVGDLLYYDGTAHNITKTSSGNTKIGVATAVAASGDTTGNVKLGPTVG
jgi:predicted RecA/RadA family phage recombinase